MPQYVALLKRGRVAVFGDVQRQAGGNWSVQLKSYAEAEGSPEASHPERLSVAERDEAGRQIREQAELDGIAGPWS